MHVLVVMFEWTLYTSYYFFPFLLRVNLCLLGIEDSALLFLYLPYFLPFLLRVSPCLLGIEDSALFISLLTCLSAP